MLDDLSKFDVIAFDADDTLWHNERFFKLSQNRFCEMLSDYVDIKTLENTLLAAEIRNLGHYGFGVKGFTLSMIETAIEVTEGRVEASVIKQLLDIGQEMLQHPLELLDGAHIAISHLAQTHPLYLITKGDLLHQERKLAQSQLGEYFTGVEIVSDKTPTVYQHILSKIGCAPKNFLMIGNSVKSDIQPVLEIGGWACYVPFESSWEYEHGTIPLANPRFMQITSLTEILN